MSHCSGYLMLLTEKQKRYFYVTPCNASLPCQSYSLKKVLICGTAWRIQGVGAVPLKKKNRVRLNLNYLCHIYKKKNILTGKFLLKLYFVLWSLFSLKSKSLIMSIP